MTSPFEDMVLNALAKWATFGSARGALPDPLAASRYKPMSGCISYPKEPIYIYIYIYAHGSPKNDAKIICHYRSRMLPFYLFWGCPGGDYHHSKLK